MCTYKIQIPTISYYHDHSEDEPGNVLEWAVCCASGTVKTRLLADKSRVASVIDLMTRGVPAKEAYRGYQDLS